MTEHGKVSLPTSPSTFKICYTPSAFSKELIQQPNTRPVANFVSFPNPHPTGRLISFNRSFIVYGVRKGLVRVIDRVTALRTLLRGHSSVITDVAFFSESTKAAPESDTDMLGTVGGKGDDSNVIIWRIGRENNVLTSVKLLEINLQCAVRIVWHPFNPNLFMLLHSGEVDNESNTGASESTVVATVVESMKLITFRHEEEGHAVSGIRKGAIDPEHNPNRISGSIVLAVDGDKKGAQINDLCWSNRDARHVLSAHEGGFVKLWDLSITEEDEVTCLMTVHAQHDNDDSVEKCIFLSHYYNTSETTGSGEISDLNQKFITAPFLTVSKRGLSVTLWSPFTVNGTVPTKVRSFKISCDPTFSFCVDICNSPPTSALPSTYVLFANKEDGDVYCVHLSAQKSDILSPNKTTLATVTGFDYVIPFKILHPIYSFDPVSVPSKEEGSASGKFDMKIYTVQNKAVQILMLTSCMCENPPLLEEGSASGVQGYERKEITLPLLEPSGETGTENDSFEEHSYDVDKTGNDEAEVEYDDYEDDDLEEEGRDGDQNEEGTNDTVMAILPPPPGLVEINAEPNEGSFSNWLGNLAVVKTANEIPTNETPTKAQSQSLNMDETNVSSGLVELSDLPLPNDPDENSSGSSASCSTEVKQKFLSPYALLSSSTVKAQEAETNKSNESGSVRLISGRIFENDNLIDKKDKPKNRPSLDKSKVATKKEKKISPKPPKNTRKVGDHKPFKVAGVFPIPSSSGKISILKREEKNVLEETETKHTKPHNGTNASNENIEAIIQKSISNQFKKHESAVIAEVQNVIRKEMQTILTQTVTKNISQSVENTLTKTIQPSITKSIKENLKMQAIKIADTVAESVKDPVTDTFYKSMTECMIPAFESATQEMFAQVSIAMKSRLEHEEKRMKELREKEFKSITKQMGEMSRNLELLNENIANLNATQNTETMQPRYEYDEPVDKVQAIKDEIIDHLKNHRYEQGFTSALSASDVDLAVFVCENCDMATVLEGDTPRLSQPILICLMQQLGAELTAFTNKNLKVELTWLQNIAVTLDPHNESIKDHVLTVCQQLINNISIKMEGGDPMLRRPLQMLLQVIRGISNA